MERFFAKHTRIPDEGDAIRMVHDKVEDALYGLSHEKGDKYLRELASAYTLICDIFEAKGMDVNLYVQQQ